MERQLNDLAGAYPEFPKEAFERFLSVLEACDNDVTSWSAEEIAEEFSWWVSGSQLDEEDEGGPKPEWVDLYEKLGEK
jgi:hypothetical protein